MRMQKLTYQGLKHNKKGKTMKNKFNDDGEFFTSDNPEESNSQVDQSLQELIEMMDQKLENKPKSENLLRSWKGEVNNLAYTINTRADRKIYSSV